MHRPSGEYLPERKVTGGGGEIEKSYEQQGFVRKPQECNVQQARLRALEEGAWRWMCVEDHGVSGQGAGVLWREAGG